MVFFFIKVPVIFSQDLDADIQRAVSYYNEGNYAEAAELITKWLPDVKESYGGNDTAVYLKILSWAGYCYYQAGNYYKAEPLMGTSVIIDIEQPRNYPINHEIKIP